MKFNSIDFVSVELEKVIYEDMGREYTKSLALMKINFHVRNFWKFPKNWAFVASFYGSQNGAKMVSKWKLRTKDWVREVRNHLARKWKYEKMRPKKRKSLGEFKFNFMSEISWIFENVEILFKVIDCTVWGNILSFGSTKKQMNSLQFPPFAKFNLYWLALKIC